MASPVIKLLVILTSFVVVNGQYETHDLSGVLPVSTPATVTLTETVYKTHPLRVIITSDVWVTETTNVQKVVTSYSTIYNFVPAAPRTVTSLLRVTSTPVFISTVEIMVNPTRTLVSVFTRFSTTTETVNYWQSITHVSIVHSVETIPVWSTQTLIQEDSTTVTQVITTLVTSTQQSYM